MGYQATEETLDPENWDELRTFGHRMLDDMMDVLEDNRARAREGRFD